MPRYLIALCILFATSGCLSTIFNPEDEFYNTISDWDIQHVPIIRPFKASSTYPGQWYINGAKEIVHLGSNGSGAIPVYSIGVTHQYIYGQTDDNRWYLFNTNTLLYSEYKTENELEVILKTFKLAKNKISSCDDHFEQLSKGKRCYWHPKRGEVYPTFEEHHPDTVYTVFLEGKDSITDIRLNGPIRKTVTKIYHFKINNSLQINDSLYISFDKSVRRYINNKDIYTVFVENEKLVDLSVYDRNPDAHKYPLDLYRKKYAEKFALE